MSHSNLANAVLQLIQNAQNGVDSLKIASDLQEDHQKVIGAIKSLEAWPDLITVSPLSTTNWQLTDEGVFITTQGSHEFLTWKSIDEKNGSLQDTIKKENPIGFSKAMSNGWILVKKDPSGVKVFRKTSKVTDTAQQALELISSNLFDQVTEAQLKDLKKRKLIKEVVQKHFKVGPGTKFTLELVKPETDLTADMLTSGAWKKVEFKPYNFNALGVQPDSGHLHPLMKVRSEFRQIFLEMGFSEMPTNRYVESSFWNFDALFQPQQHPARDAHDTFFVSDPATTTDLPQDYVERVKKVHSQGGFGSQGYGYDWKIKEAQKNLLRTHTTAVSARMLYNLAKSKEGFKPVKYFSIDRVFRNETLDATHLAEFHQVEGVIAGYELTLGDLLGILQEFFNKLGLSQLKFKPAYNPYTEPSMEIFCYHPGLEKWVEIGNSGMFRPEMLLPMNLPENVRVIAWGLSLERPTMIRYGLNNIRDLVGPKVDLEMVYENPLCRLETRPLTRANFAKEDVAGKCNVKKCQVAVNGREKFNGEESHKMQVTIVKHEDNKHEVRKCSNEELRERTRRLDQIDFVVNLDDKSSNVGGKKGSKLLINNRHQKEGLLLSAAAIALWEGKNEKKQFLHYFDRLSLPLVTIRISVNPDNWPRGIIWLSQLLDEVSVFHLTPNTSFAGHSAAIVNAEKEFTSTIPHNPNSKFHVVLTWEKVGHHPVLIHPVSNVKITGLVNIARCVSMLILEKDSKFASVTLSTQIDNILDFLHSNILHGSADTQNRAMAYIGNVLLKRLWMVGDQPTVADVCMWSILHSIVKKKQVIRPEILEYFELCNDAENRLLILQRIIQNHINSDNEQSSSSNLQSDCL